MPCGEPCLIPVCPKRQPARVYLNRLHCHMQCAPLAPQLRVRDTEAFLLLASAVDAYGSAFTAWSRSNGMHACTVLFPPLAHFREEAY